MPPPRTLSASFKPVGIRSPGSSLKTSIRDLESRYWIFLPLFLAETLNSDKVPHSLQEGHCPFHLGKSSPQAEQRKVVFVFIFAMMGLEIVYHGSGNQGTITSPDLKKNTIGVCQSHQDFYPMLILS